MCHALVIGHVSAFFEGTETIEWPTTSSFTLLLYMNTTKNCCLLLALLAQ